MHSLHRTACRLSVLALLATGCRASPRPAAGGEATVTDDAGRAVTVGIPARRVVSLAPSLTELVFALGAGDRLVGRTVYCRVPREALRVPAVGDGLAPNVEAVVSRHPDLVLLYRSPLTETAARQLASIGIPALLLRNDRLADVARTARLLGRLFEIGAAGDSIADRIDTLLASAAQPARVRIAFVAWDAPPIVIGGGSYLTEMARLAGAVNVFADLTAASAQVSLETIAVRDPDWIVVLTDSGPRLPAYVTRPEWRTVRAVRERHFLYLPGDRFGQPSPRAPEAVALLHELLESPR